MADDYSGSEHDYSGSEDELPPLSEAAPDLYKITYSREATIAAIKDYYGFLTKMYMDTDDIAMPPEGEWPDMENIRELGKSDEVIELLRFLPYTRPSGREAEVHAAGFCQFEDWAQMAQRISTLPRPLSPDDVDSLLRKTQGNWEHIPPYVVGLVRSPDFQMLLDTRFGIIFFIGADATPGPSRKAESTRHLYKYIEAEPRDYAPVEEESWRGEKAPCAWEITSFFELLKFHFRELNYIPLYLSGDLVVKEDFEGEWSSREDIGDDDLAAVYPRVREVFREYGWPDLSQYRKHDCLEAVGSVVQEHLERIDGSDD